MSHRTSLTNWLRFLSTALFALVASASSFGQGIRWPTDAMSLGGGYDTLTGEVRGRCVTTPSKVVVAGEKVQYYLASVDNESSLMSAMSVSVSAKYAGVEASGKFAESKSFNRFSAYLLVNIVVEAKSESLVAGDKQPELLPDAAKLLVQNFPRFRERCGDKFMATRSVGGSYFALVEVRTSSEADRQLVYASLSGGTLAFKGAAEMNSALQSAVSNRSTTVTSLRTGSKGPVSSDLAAVKADAEALPTKLATDQEPFRGVLVDYTALNVPNQVRRGQFNDDGKLRYIAQADAQASEIRSAMSDLQFALNNSDQFQGIDAAAFRQGIRTADAAITDLVYDVRRCFRSADPCGAYVPKKVALPVVPERIAGRTRQVLEAQVTAYESAINKSRQIQNGYLYNDEWVVRNGGGEQCFRFVMLLREKNKLDGGFP